MVEFLKPLLRSKKVQIFITGLLAQLAVTKLNLDPEVAKSLSEGIFYGVLTLIGAQAVSDFGSGGKTSANHPENVKANGKGTTVNNVSGG